MEKLSEDINNRVLHKVAEKYNLTERDTQRIIKIYADYMFYHMNQTDLSKDTGKQYSRFIFENIGAVYLNRIFLIENDYRMGRIPKDIYKFAKTWFSLSYKYMQHKLEIFNTINKVTNGKRQD
jgi:hypothetical protein